MEKQFKFVRVAKGMRSDTAYAVFFQGQEGEVFLGYAVGRGQGWDRQFTLDPEETVKPTYEFLYAQPSRQYVAGLLVEDWAAAAKKQEH